MRAVGIIAEFDPFHDGHAYLIKEAKRITGADFAVVVMSGDFVQRGEPAVFDKFERAFAAVKGGADAVFEIPTAYATSGAKIFSEAGVRLLASTGVVDSICFGSECGDIEKLKRVSRLLDDESDEFKEKLSKYLKNGDSYPKAREKALVELGAADEYIKLMREPNNILGIHYISAVRNCKCDIEPFTVKRVGAGYHETTGAECKGFESATGIRNKIFNHELISYGQCPIHVDDLSQILMAELLRMTPDDAIRYADVTDSLARSALKHREESLTFSEMVEKIKSKNNLYTQVSRALLHILLGMSEELRGKPGSIAVPYLRLLAFREGSSVLLRDVSDNSSAVLITKPADAPCRNEELFQLDIRAASIYNGAILAKYGIHKDEDMKRSPVILRTES